MKKENISKQREKELRTIIATWVNRTDGRFREHTSDEFLCYILFNKFITRYSQMQIANVSRSDEQVAYDVGVIIFENGLEGRLGFSCNGHHVAQDFSSCFKDK